MVVRVNKGLKVLSEFYFDETYFDEKLFDTSDYKKELWWCYHQIGCYPQDADNVFYFEILAQTYNNIGQPDSARKYIKKAIITAAPELSPNFSRARFWMSASRVR